MSIKLKDTTNNLPQDAISTAGQNDVNTDRNAEKNITFAFSKMNYLNFLLRFRRQNLHAKNQITMGSRDLT